MSTTRSHEMQSLPTARVAPERAAPARAGEDRASITGISAAIGRLREEVAGVAPSDATVLLTGETGTGKGLVAHVIHRLSTRSTEPFVHVDCAALSPSVIESELFGHESGAFTGALGRRTGRFEAAGVGTVFLDEIGDLEPRLQSKLLRVIEDRRYERVGGTRSLLMEARVVAATSHDLRRALREGRFRADLYFRLNVFHLELPPLRARLADLPQLVREGFARLTDRLGMPPPIASDDFFMRLGAYSWPGNVRELMNVLERLALRRAGQVMNAAMLDGILDDELPPGRAVPVGFPVVGDRVAPNDARRGIVAALSAAGGNVARAARLLGIPRSTLRYRLEKHGLGELARSREWRDTIAARGLGERSLEPPVDRRNAT